MGFAVRLKMRGPHLFSSRLLFHLARHARACDMRVIECVGSIDDTETVKKDRKKEANKAIRAARIGFKANK